MEPKQTNGLVVITGTINSHPEDDRQAAFQDAIKNAMRLDPDVIMLGEVRSARLSRRKARKLAYQYRGGKRGQWYVRYLAGELNAFLVNGRRLGRIPVFGPTKITTVHSLGVAETLKSLLMHNTCIQIEDPPEYVIEFDRFVEEEPGKTLDELMLEMPSSWRWRWCESSAGGCACMGCANVSGWLVPRGYTKPDWEAWVERNPRPASDLSAADAPKHVRWGMHPELHGPRYVKTK